MLLFRELKGARKQGNIAAEANVSLFAAQGNICCKSKNVSEFVEKHFASSANVSLLHTEEKFWETMCDLPRENVH